MIVIVFLLFFRRSTKAPVSTPESTKQHIPCKICRSIKDDMINQNLMYDKIESFRNKTISKYSSSDRYTREVTKILANNWLFRIFNSSIDDSCSFVCDNKITRSSRNNHRFSTDHGIGESRPKIKQKSSAMVSALSKPTELGCDECVIILDLMFQFGPSYVANKQKDGLLYDACMSIEFLRDHCSVFTHESTTKFLQYMSENLSPYEVCVVTNVC